MRKITMFISALFIGLAASKAQTIATFESLPLPSADTYYVNYSASGTDVGFTDGLAHFQCFYDTSFGGFWATGFALSNKTDSVTSGYTNEYSAKPAAGYGGSAKYMVAYVFNESTFGYDMNLRLTGAAIGEPVQGFYITNNTYAFNSTRDGDGFAKKFGGTTHNDPDWFKLTVKGYSAGALTTDSVDFYLADYRFAHNDSDYIVNTWKWVNLMPLGHVDSLHFSLSSSDTGSSGMNTPAYFCIDNFTTNEMSAGVAQVQSPAAKVYPVPTIDVLNIDVADQNFDRVQIVNIAGVVVFESSLSGLHNELNIKTLAPGQYLLKMIGSEKSASTKFTKN